MRGVEGEGGVVVVYGGGEGGGEDGDGVGAAVTPQDGRQLSRTRGRLRNRQHHNTMSNCLLLQGLYTFEITETKTQFHGIIQGYF